MSKRRFLIFIIVCSVMKEPADAVSLNAASVPQFMADIDIHNLGLMDSRDLSGEQDGAIFLPRFIRR